MEEVGHLHNVYNIQNAESVNIVGEQHVGHQTNVADSIIGRLAAGGEDVGLGQVQNAEAPNHGNVEADSTKEKKEKEETRLSGKIVMFNNEPLCKGARVYRGRQELLPGKVRDIAVKLIQYQEKNMRELKILIKLTHPNVVNTIDAGEYRGLVPWIYIAMELCSQNLQSYFDDIKDKSIDIEKATSFFKQLVDGVAFIHKHKIAHRDLKPDNILISICKNFIKLSDFGLSKEIPDGHSVASITCRAAGSEGYRAPEMYRNDSKSSPRSDIFPLGIISHSIFTNGKHPFGSDPYDWSYNIRKNINKDLSDIPQFESPNEQRREQLVDLIEKMLRKSPRDRPTAAKIRDHAFFMDSTKNDGQSRVMEDMDSSSSSATLEPAQNGVVSPLTEVESDGRLMSKGVHRGETGIVVFDSSTRHLCGFNLIDHSVTKTHKFHDKMDWCFTAVSFKNYIYVFMGNRSVYRLNYCDAIATWERIQDMPHSHGWKPPAVSFSDAICLVGGSSGSFKKAASKYDLTRNRWERLTDKPTPTSYSTLLASQGCVYSFGGEIDIGKQTNKVERLNLSSMIWTELESMKRPRSASSAVEFCGKYYLIGGSFRGNELRSVEMYDHEINQWTDMSPMSRSRAGLRSYVIGGKLFAVGGCKDSSTVEIFSFEKDEWNELEIPEMCILDSILIQK